MNIERALAVDGWMMESELVYLAEIASKSRNIAEIGSWLGRSTCALAANALGDVSAVDTWKGSQEHASMLSGRPEDWLFDQFRENTRGLKISPYQVPSLEAAEFFSMADARFDLIFLDASHDYDNVKADILAWTPLLSEGGVLCGHDYDPPHWMGVHDAVNEFVPKFRVIPNTTIWTTEGAQ